MGELKLRLRDVPGLIAAADGELEKLRALAGKYRARLPHRKKHKDPGRYRP